MFPGCKISLRDPIGISSTLIDRQNIEFQFRLYIDTISHSIKNNCGNILWVRKYYKYFFLIRKDKTSISRWLATRERHNCIIVLRVLNENGRIGIWEQCEGVLSCKCEDFCRIGGKCTIKNGNSVDIWCCSIVSSCFVYLASILTITINVDFDGYSCNHDYCWIENRGEPDRDGGSCLDYSCGVNCDDESLVGIGYSGPLNGLAY
jgi:hypothetical protein